MLPIVKTINLFCLCKSMGRKRPRNKLAIQKVWVENDPGSTKRGWNIEVRRRLNERGLLSEHFGANIIEIGQKLRMPRRKIWFWGKHLRNPIVSAEKCHFFNIFANFYPISIIFVANLMLFCTRNPNNMFIWS